MGEESHGDRQGGDCDTKPFAHERRSLTRPPRTVYGQGRVRPHTPPAAP